MDVFTNDAWRDFKLDQFSQKQIASSYVTKSGPNLVSLLNTRDHIQLPSGPTYKLLCRSRCNTTSSFSCQCALAVLALTLVAYSDI